MGSPELGFFEDDCRRAGFTSPARHRGDGGASRETDSIFSTLRARRAGHGARRGRGSPLAGPRSIPRRPSRAVPRSALRGRRENAPPVEKNTNLFCYIFIHFVNIHMSFIFSTRKTCIVLKSGCSTARMPTSSLVLLPCFRLTP